jgi:hypothetical protein
LFQRFHLWLPSDCAFGAEYLIATDFEPYRREHGSYLESKREAVPIIISNPRYVARIIRVDQWHQPYEYEGGLNTFVLRSKGPDGN